MPFARSIEPSPFVETPAEALIRMRAARARVFAGELSFGDPAWDILLALKAAEGSTAAPMTTAVGEHTGCAQTTAQRWLLDLERRGLVRREPSHLDRRKVCVSLTERGSRLMADALDAMVGAMRAAQNSSVSA